MSMILSDHGAEFDSTERYRYTLWRTIPSRPSHSRILFIMLNPSTADEQHDDPTIARCTRFSAKWGFGKMLIGNIFALRATDPETLYHDYDPIGPENDKHLVELHGLADLTILAWGNHGRLSYRSDSVMELLRRNSRWNQPIRCFGKTDSGEPKHPLYLPLTQELVDYP